MNKLLKTTLFVLSVFIINLLSIYSKDFYQDDSGFLKFKNNNCLTLGMGGGFNKFAMGLDYYYAYIGVGISFTIRKEIPDDKKNCDACWNSRFSTPYDRTSEKRYNKGFINYELLCRLPTLKNIHLTGSVGYFENKWVDVKTYEDSIYPTEYEYIAEGFYKSGISYGAGINYILDIFVFGLEYKYPLGVLGILGVSLD